MLFKGENTIYLQNLVFYIIFVLYCYIFTSDLNYQYFQNLTIFTFFQFILTILGYIEIDIFILLSGKWEAFWEIFVR